MEQKKTGVAEIAKQVAKETEVPYTVVSKVVNKFIKDVINRVGEGEHVVIPGLVTFHQYERAEHEIIPYITGKKVIIPAHVSVRARVAKALRAQVATREALK